MEPLPLSLNYELSHDLHFDNFEGAAQQILDSGKNVAAAEASTPTISTLDVLANSEFLQKIGASIFNSIQLKHQKANEATLNSSEVTMDFDFATNHVVLDSSSVDQLQQQLEYDKLMNEVWIGIVFTLILISMVFCVCSCFLYHQFRTWKRNYHANATSSTQCTIVDIEALKLQPDAEDPVPEYTLVSGLPSYEAALELLHKSPQSSCLIVYPSVFNVFNKHERVSNTAPTATTAAAAAPTTAATAIAAAAVTTSTCTAIDTVDTAAIAMPQTSSICEATIPLLPSTATNATATTTATSTPTYEGIKPSYAELFGFKSIDEKKKSTRCQNQKDEPTKGQNDKC